MHRLYLNSDNSNNMIAESTSQSSSCVDAAMYSTYETLTSLILQKYAAHREISSGVFCIGIAGPPGAGKSTMSAALFSRLPRSIVIPMDGYHYTRAKLREFPNADEAIARRGTEWTFDAEKFVADIKVFKESGQGSFPSFDHGVGDPIENSIIVNAGEIDIVLIEGNYLLLPEHPWSNLIDNRILDFSIFILTDLDTVCTRVFKRHVAVGRTEEVARDRVETNDKLNAKKILQCASRADLIVESR